MASKKKRSLQKKGVFICEKCGLSTPYHSFGTSHPFSKAFVLLEPSYLARDPFTPSPQPLVLGSHCSLCNKTVCAACSIFYTRRFCTDCVQSNIAEFPREVQQEVLKNVESVALLAGLGAGYLLACLLTRHKSTDPQLSRTIAALSSEVARLREVVEAVKSVERGWRSVRSVETSDFVSAQSESIDSDDEFFETTPNTSEAGLDERGRGTQESEEVCLALVKEIKERLEGDPHNVGLLWRLARVLTHQSMHSQDDAETEKELLLGAAEYAREALSLDDGCWQAHQWYATAVGSMSKFQGTQQKIEQGFEYKEHIDRAISLNPINPTLHYLSGRWCYEVAGLSWLERKAAAALFATPPEATYDETLQSFMRAEELNPGAWKGNILMIAKCHLKLSDVPSAIEWLHKAYQLPTTTPDDVSSQREVEELLTQHDLDFAT